MKVYFASDHAGFEIKNKLVEYISSLGYEVEDCGANTYDKDDDYPDFVHLAASKLSDDILAGKDSRAIVAGASGQGEAIVANKHFGVRCALYYGNVAIEQTDIHGKKLGILNGTRDHNDANALSLGLRFVSADEACDVVREWLERPFTREERHVRRIEKIEIQNNSLLASGTTLDTI